MISAPDTPASLLTGVPGWLTHNEELLLRDYAVDVPIGGYVINIGVEYGRSLATLAKYARSAYVLGVDIKMKPGIAANLAQAGLDSKYHLMEKDSAKVVWNGAPIDLIFIDGDHSIAGVLRDIDNWIPHVKIGGVVVFHDCACITNLSPHTDHFDVTRAVTTWQQKAAPQWMIDKMCDSAMAFRRSG